MKKYLFIILLSFSSAAKAQCLSGDCKNGWGKMDMGYAIYEGQFKNGKPDGNGTMDYGNGDKYQGQWKNGAEHGRGLLYEKNIATQIEYDNGVKIGKVKPLVAIGTDGVEKQKEDIKGCISGDCANGYGVMEFPSGNRYEGNFKNYQFHGKGKMNFKGGNYVDAEFVEHAPKTGVFYYIEGDTKFTGTFGPDGQPVSGTYVSGATTGIVEVVNRSITSVKNPRQDSLIKALNEPQKMQCRSCGGKGGSGSTTPGSSTTLGGIGHTTPYNGYVTWDYPPQTFSRPSTYTYSSCSICNGKGYTTY
ncbi:MAG: hypothetical protein KA319_12390 [Ferruginibacter sp.]|nr:hypothetical protein [Ferruginibacter sp.]